MIKFLYATHKSGTKHTYDWFMENKNNILIESGRHIIRYKLEDIFMGNDFEFTYQPQFCQDELFKILNKVSVYGFPLGKLDKQVQAINEYNRLLKEEGLAYESRR